MEKDPAFAADLQARVPAAARVVPWNLAQPDLSGFIAVKVGGARFLEQLLPRSPLTTRWLDYLAMSRTCELTSVPSFFGLRPARFTPENLAYLRQKRWLAEMGRLALGR